MEMAFKQIELICKACAGAGENWVQPDADGPSFLLSCGRCGGSGRRGTLMLTPTCAEATKAMEAAVAAIERYDGERQVLWGIA